MGHSVENCSCQDSVAPLTSQNLLPFIRKENIYALNERVPDSIVNVFQIYEERLKNTEGCVSDQADDSQLVRTLLHDCVTALKHRFKKLIVSNSRDIDTSRSFLRNFFNKFKLMLTDALYIDQIVHIPFLYPCKLTSLRCIGGENGQAPSRVQLYINQDTLDFSSIHEATPVQVVELSEDSCGILSYPLKASKLSNVTHLTLYFTETFGAERTKLLYIGLFGEGSQLKRESVVTVYEARANPSDHSILRKSVEQSLA